MIKKGLPIRFPSASQGDRIAERRSHVLAVLHARAGRGVPNARPRPPEQRTRPDWCPVVQGRGREADMANNPRKMKDPTEAALSAIQDALNLRESSAQAPMRGAETTVAEPPVATDPDFGRRPTRAPAMDEELFRDERDIQLSLPGVEEPSQRRAANDDRQSVGQILQALQQRPARTPYPIALGLAICWAIVAVTAALTIFDSGPRALLVEGGTPLFGLAIAIALPSMFFVVI